MTMKKLHETLIQLKDLITNIAGGLFIVSGSVVMAAESGFLPNGKIVLTAKAVGLVCAALVAYLTGKKPKLND